jgi:hypothetical protein
MPNWCANKLEIEFDIKEKCSQFLELLGKGKDDNQFDFGLFVPPPACIPYLSTVTERGEKGGVQQKLVYSTSDVKFKGRENAEHQHFTVNWRDAERLMAQHGANNWYNWNCEHWGTKWNASDARVEVVSGTEVVIQFDSAWSPPTPVIDAMAARLPSARILFFHIETGCDFGGLIEYRGGEVINCEEGTARDCAKLTPWHASFLEGEDESEEEED